MSSTSPSRPWPRSSWLPNSLASDGRIARTRFTPPRISAPAWRRGLFAPSFEFAHFIREMIATRSFHVFTSSSARRAESSAASPIASGRRCDSPICATTCASPTAPRTKRSFPSFDDHLVAADRSGSICRGVEFDPLYVDVIVRRYEAATGNHAGLVETGERPDLLAPLRSNEAAAGLGPDPAAPPAVLSLGSGGAVNEGRGCPLWRSEVRIPSADCQFR